MTSTSTGSTLFARFHRRHPRRAVPRGVPRGIHHAARCFVLIGVRFRRLVVSELGLGCVSKSLQVSSYGCSVAKLEEVFLKVGEGDKGSVDGATKIDIRSRIGTIRNFDIVWGTSVTHPASSTPQGCMLGTPHTCMLGTPPSCQLYNTLHTPSHAVWHALLSVWLVLAIQNGMPDSVPVFRGPARPAR